MELGWPNDDSGSLDVLKMWQKRNALAKSEHVDAGYQEWQEIIRQDLVPVPAAMLEDEESDEAQRPRSSALFLGPQFVTEQELRELLARYPALSKT